MKKADTCNLATCFLCRQSLEGWLPLVGAHKKNIAYKKGEMIFQEGQPVKGIFFLYAGTVKVHKHWGMEKEIILHFARTGDMIGYRGLGTGKYPVTATALEPVTVCFIDLVFFESSLQVNHSLTYSLLKFYMQELQEAEGRMRNLAHMDVKGRLAAALLQLKTQFGVDKDGSLNILLTRQDLASYTGTTYETLFRTMNLLVKEKLIRLSGKKITLLKETLLGRLCNKLAIAEK